MLFSCFASGERKRALKSVDKEEMLWNPAVLEDITDEEGKFLLFNHLSPLGSDAGSRQHWYLHETKTWKCIADEAFQPAIFIRIIKVL